MRTEKRCNGCGRTLALEHFHRCATSPDGHQYRCKDCRKAEVAKSRRQNPDWWKRHGRSQRVKHREHRRVKKLEYRHRTGAHAVHESVRKRIKRGKLARAEACSRCGRSGVQIVAHHEDYSKRWDVTWLCIKCHHAVHREAKVEG